MISTSGCPVDDARPLARMRAARSCPTGVEDKKKRARRSGRRRPNCRPEAEKTAGLAGPLHWLERPVKENSLAAESIQG
jgi:hypothetical protein